MPGRSNNFATVHRFAPRFSSDSRQLRVELQVPNGDLLLRPGMFVEADIAIAQQASAIRVPQAAIIGRQAQAHLHLSRKSHRVTNTSLAAGTSPLVCNKELGCGNSRWLSTARRHPSGGAGATFITTAPRSGTGDTSTKATP